MKQTQVQKLQRRNAFKEARTKSIVHIGEMLVNEEQLNKSGFQQFFFIRAFLPEIFPAVKIFNNFNTIVGKESNNCTISYPLRRYRIIISAVFHFLPANAVVKQTFVDAFHATKNLQNVKKLVFVFPKGYKDVHSLVISTGIEQAQELNLCYRVYTNAGY